MSLTAEQISQFSVACQQLVSAAAVLSLKRPVTARAAYATNGAPFTLPDEVKSFCIVNLGLSALGVTFSNITVAGITGITLIYASIKEFSFSCENDQNYIKAGSIIVTPAVGHIALVQYLING
jgi:hypothetical protein